MHTITVCALLYWPAQKGQEADRCRVQRAEHNRRLAVQIRHYEAEGHLLLLRSKRLFYHINIPVQPE